MMMAASILMPGAGALGKGASKAFQIVKNNKSTMASIEKAVSKGGSLPGNLREQLVMKTVIAKPTVGKQIAIKIGDPRFKSILGWKKMEYTHRTNPKITVHYFYNKYTRSVKQLKVKR